MILQEIRCLVCVCVHMHIWMLCMECLLHFSFYLIYLFIYLLTHPLFTYLLLTQGLSLNVAFTALACCTGTLHESIYLCLPVLGWQMCDLHPTFYMGSGNWSSDPHACKAFIHGVISLPQNLATLRRDNVSKDAWRVYKIQETGCAVPIAPASGLHTFWNSQKPLDQDLSRYNILRVEEIRFPLSNLWIASCKMMPSHPKPGPSPSINLLWKLVSREMPQSVRCLLCKPRDLGLIHRSHV